MTPAQPLSPARPTAQPEPLAPELGWATRAKFAFVRGYLYTLYCLFGLWGLYRFSRFWGVCEALINHHWRRRFGKRLERVFGPGLAAADRWRHTREHICRIRCDKAFYTILDMLPRQQILARVRWTGREHLDRSVARGKGTYILFSHHGSHHVGGLLLALQGYTRLAAIRDPQEGALRRYVQEQFMRSFPEFREHCTIFTTATSPRDLFRHFDGNGVLGSGLDVDHKRQDNARTATVTVFGQPHEWMTGTVNIALRTRSTILPAFILSEPGYHWRYLFHPPLADPDTAANDDATVQAVMDAYAAGIEAHVRAYPEHISKTK